MYFHPPLSRLDLSPERVSGRKGVAKSGRNQKSFICGHKLDMNLTSAWLCESHQINILNCSFTLHAGYTQGLTKASFYLHFKMPSIFSAAMKMLKRGQALILVLLLSASNCKMLFNSALGHRRIFSCRLVGNSSPGVQVVLSVRRVMHMMCE